MIESESTQREPFISPLEEHNCCQTANEEEFRAEHSDGSADAQYDSYSVSASSARYPSDNIILLAKDNIQRVLSLTFFSFAFRSIWSQSVLSIYIILVWKDRLDYVGYVLAVTSLIQTLSSILTRCASRWSDYVANNTKMLLVLASLIGPCAMGVSLYAIEESLHQSSFPLFLFANGLCGMSWGVLDSTIPIVFTKSANVVPEIATKKYNACHNMVRLGNVVGTVLALVVFQHIGNAWSVKGCVAVMAIGLGCNVPVPPGIFSLKSISLEWSDEYEGDASETGDDVTEIEEQNAVAYEPLNAWEEEMNPESNIFEVSSTEYHSFFQQVYEAEDDSSRTCGSVFSANKMRVPLLIHFADILSSFACGMSIWYFPVYLVQQSKLLPMSIQVLYLIIPVGQWLSPMLAKSLGRIIGPCRACITMQWTYILFMLSMIVCQSKGYPVWIVSMFYVLHASAMNSTSSLSKDMFKQYVPTDERYKWDVAENLQMFLWSFAGLVGGYVVGRWGLLVNFYATAVLQLFASVPFATLYFLFDPRLDDEQMRGDPAAIEDDLEECSNSDANNGDCGSQLQSKSSSSFGSYFDHPGLQSSATGLTEASSPSTQATESDSDISSDSSTFSIHIA